MKKLRVFSMLAVAAVAGLVVAHAGPDWLPAAILVGAVVGALVALTAIATGWVS